MRTTLAAELLVGQDAAFHVPQFHEPVTSDRYAGNWPTEAFRKVGVTVKPSDWTRSEIYLAALPMVMSNQQEAYVPKAWQFVILEGPEAIAK